jgi:hypothetical protein
MQIRSTGYLERNCDFFSLNADWPNARGEEQQSQKIDEC